MFKRKNKKKPTTQDSSIAAPNIEKTELPSEIEFFSSQVLKDPMPSPNEVESLTQKLLDDMDLQGESREKLENKSISDKWNMLKRQSVLDTLVPSPKYLIKQLQKNVTASTISTISQHIVTIRLEWGRQFIQNFIYFSQHSSTN